MYSRLPPKGPPGRVSLPGALPPHHPQVKAVGQWGWCITNASPLCWEIEQLAVGPQNPAEATASSLLTPLRELSEGPGERWLFLLKLSITHTGDSPQPCCSPWGCEDQDPSAGPMKSGCWGVGRGRNQQAAWSSPGACGTPGPRSWPHWAAQPLREAFDASCPWVPNIGTCPPIRLSGRP